jgi:ABC-2 type transport system permease protein
MSLPIARRAVTARVRWFLGWSIGIVTFVALTLGFYPAFENESTQMNDLFDNLPDSIKSLVGIGGGIDPFSSVGYLSSQIYATLLPLLLILASVAIASSIAGDEEHGLLETSYSLPISRRRVLLERVIAAFAISVGLSVVAWAATAVTATAVGLGVGLSAMAWASVTLGILALAISAITVFVGALTGRKAVALSVGSVAAIGGYLITSLADARIVFFEKIEFLSVFSLYDVLNVLVDSGPQRSLFGLITVTVVFSAVAAVVIDHRDIRSA